MLYSKSTSTHIVRVQYRVLYRTYCVVPPIRIRVGAPAASSKFFTHWAVAPTSLTYPGNAKNSYLHDHHYFLVPSHSPPTHEIATGAGSLIGTCVPPVTE